MSDSRVQTIVIVGSGLNVAMVSAILSAQLAAHRVKLMAVELTEIPQLASAESSGSEFLALCELAGIDFRDIVTSADGTFRLGSSYQHGARVWFVPYGAFGMQASPVGFESAMLRCAALNNESIANYSLAAQAALSKKFAIPGKDRPDLRNALKFGVTLSTLKYRQHLLDVSKRRGVEYKNSHSVKNVTRKENGRITQIELSSGEQVSGDFWIDCSGDGALLSDCRKNIGLSLPWDSVAYGNFDCADESMPGDEYILVPEGWFRTKALQGSRHYEFYYNSSQVDVNTRDSRVSELTGGRAIQSESQALALGANSTPWRVNCLSLGHASTNIGELVFSDLALVQAGLVLFLDLYPISSEDEWDAVHYNSQWRAYTKEALDYTLLHAVLGTQENGKPQSSALQIPSELETRLEVFRKRGKIEELSADAVLESQWLGMMVGMGIEPTASPLNVEIVPDEKIVTAVEKVREIIRRTVATMPAHDDFVQKFFKNKQK